MRYFAEAPLGTKNKLTDNGVYSVCLSVMHTLLVLAGYHSDLYYNGHSIVSSEDFEDCVWLGGGGGGGW